MPELSFDHFSCWYKTKKENIRALNDLTFDIRDGEFFVIAGESGCGKTTLLKCVLGLGAYLQGTLTIDGISAEAQDAGLRNVGFVRQETGLYPHMTVYENIAFPLRTIHTAQAEVDSRVKALAAQLEIDYLLTRIPKQLSIGQQQRVAIARALIKNPTLVLFDEPFSNLDPTLRSAQRRLVKVLHETYRTTVLFVTHDLGEAFSLADRLLVLEQGSMVDLGTPRELLHNAKSDLLRNFLK